MQAPEGTLISYATQPGNVAQDGADVYGPDNLLDGNDATAWVEGSSGQGVDDYLVLEFDALQSVSGLTIRNGDDKNRDIYGKNSGVKDVEVRFSTRDRLENPRPAACGAEPTDTGKMGPAHCPLGLSWMEILRHCHHKYVSTCSNGRCALCDCLGFACAAF